MLFLSLVLLLIGSKVTGLLYPYESPTRQVKSLNGLWKFKISPSQNQNIGFHEGWHSRRFEELGDYLEIPVPASYNDITTNKTIRDFLGWAWYQHEFYVPSDWKSNYIVYIHFGSVHYYAKVYVNSKEVGSHEGGHLSFRLNVTDALRSYGLNMVTVAVNNTLNNDTIPQGFLEHTNNPQRYPPGYQIYSHNFDYFDYAGIDRNVVLYAVPVNDRIKGIIVKTSVVGTTGNVKYQVDIVERNVGECHVTLEDRLTRAWVAEAVGCEGELAIPNVKLWWPIGSGDDRTPFLYTLNVDSTGNGGDIYSLPVGIRSISWDQSNILINGEPVYLRGFGMHEDADVRGRGFDNALLVRDLELVAWTGANVVRTSHYPYSEEFLNQADIRGILVIAEAPACSLSQFGDKILTRHKQVVLEMVLRDRNHPSVIMWSLANEPYSNQPTARDYFMKLLALVKSIDVSRPVTFVTSQPLDKETAVTNMDVVCVNRYSGWYQDSGRSELIEHQVIAELRAWYHNYSRPVILTEYGAGSIPGLHTLPASMWSEEYQAETLREHFSAFDSLRALGAITGEMIWNFIDFNTPQEYIRPGRCAKGLFTRTRQPKMAAYIARARYHSLAGSDHNPTINIL